LVHDRFLRQTTRVSVAADGQIANAGSGHPSMSADGRLIAFQSLASNLVPSDFNGREDCFVHSLATGVTTRISVTSAGESGNSGSRNPAISADGRIVAFQSDATNFAAGDVNQGSDVFVHDRTRSQTTRISMSVNGWSAEPALSADGRYVAFESGGSDLVLGDLNGTYDVFVHDRQNQLTARVSVNSAGLEGNGRSGKPAISADGRFVVFESEAHNLVLGDTNGRVDVFVHDRQTRRTVRVSVDSFGREGPHASRNPTISPDGRYVAFQSFSSLVAGSGGAAGAVYLHDRTTGFTSLMAIDTSGQAANAPCDKPALSVEARFIAFQTAASNLVEADTNDALDVFVHQRLLVCGFGGFDPAYECDDGNPCTADLCMDHLCRNEPNSVACNDERFCTVFDSCAAGTCQGLFLRCNDPELPVCDEELQRCVQCLEDSDCDDDNVCTNDQCDLKSSTCQFTPNSKNCNDGLFCTKPDFCLAGECIGVPRRCPNGQTCDEQSAQCIPR
jgi:Tol biopolymer transport system component